MIAIVTLLLVIGLSVIILRFATMALVLTGLSEEAASFQARSAYFGVGFTTKESEDVVNHPVRRRIIMYLMFLGNIGIAAILASMIVSYLGVAQSEHGWLNAAALVIGIAALIMLAKNRHIERMLNRILATAIKRWTALDVRDYVATLHLDRGYAVTEMKVEPGDWLAGKTVSESQLSQEGVLILGIRRENGEYIGIARGNETIHAGDVLVLYGQLERLSELDQRKGSESPAKSIRTD